MPACESLSADLSEDKNYYVFTATATGNGSQIYGYTFVYGDQQSYSVTFGPNSQNRLSAGVTHAYQKAGNYTARAVVNYSLDGESKTASSDNCQTAITIDPPASTIPNAGPGNILALYIITALTGAAIFQLRLRTIRLFRRRRRAEPGLRQL